MWERKPASVLRERRGVSGGRKGLRGWVRQR
jgi:hypothetical protein